MRFLPEFLDLGSGAMALPPALRVIGQTVARSAIQRISATGQGVELAA
jgi:hypothetical protein